MHCETAREVLWPPERPRLLEDDVVEARAHVEQCESCQANFAEERALLDALSAARQPRAPIEVREAVFDALASTRSRAAPTRGRGTMPRRASVAAVLVAAVGLTAAASLWLSESPGRALPVVDDPGIFAEDYLRRAVGLDHIVTSDPSEVRSFLRRELGMGLELIQFAGLTPERAEVCLIRGRRGALIVYKKDGASVSHYVVPRHDARPRAPAVAEYGDGPGGAQMPVVTWSTRSLDQALIGDLGPEELLELAKSGVT